MPSTKHDNRLHSAPVDIAGVSAVTVCVRSPTSHEYWVQAPQDYTFRALLTDAAAYFESALTDSYLVDRRAGSVIDDLDTTVVQRFADLCGQVCVCYCHLLAVLLVTNSHTARHGCMYVYVS
jgi:hypothetical protein